MSSAKNDKIFSLESSRGVAAIAVAVFHFKVGPCFNSGFINNAWLMIDFFFVLFGFVIALNYQGSDQLGRSLLLPNKAFSGYARLYLLMLLVFSSFELRNTWQSIYGV